MPKYHIDCVIDCVSVRGCGGRSTSTGDTYKWRPRAQRSQTFQAPGDTPGAKEHRGDRWDRADPGAVRAGGGVWLAPPSRAVEGRAGERPPTTWAAPPSPAAPRTPSVSAEQQLLAPTYFRRRAASGLVPSLLLPVRTRRRLGLGMLWRSADRRLGEMPGWSAR